MTTQEKIFKYIVKLSASGGYEHLSMRQLADKVGIVQSVLYHYFPNKERMLRYMFDTVNANLEIERAKLPPKNNLFDLLKQRINFQFDHAEEVTAGLKYYLAHRKRFRRTPVGFLPVDLYATMKEVLEFGREEGELKVRDINTHAKYMTHVINSYILEYYPDIPKGKEREKLVKSLAIFLTKFLKEE